MKKLLTLILASLLILGGCADTPEDISCRTNSIAEAEYPAMTPYPNEADYYDEKNGDFDYEAYEADFVKWQETSGKRNSAELRTIVDGMAPFVQKTAAQLLADVGTENRTYSPLNLYFALGMLAELTDGNSRAQVLDLMGADDPESLRNDIAALWESNYSDDGRVTSILANSLWLNDTYTFKQPTMDILARNHRASSYAGTMGDEGFSEVFRNWMNEQTGGLLEDSVKDLGFTADTVLALASTIYFAAGWEEEFSASQTVETVFHAPDGDISCEFLNQSLATSYYYGENFGAAAKSLGGSGSMWLILPDEGVSPEELLTDEEVSALYLGGERNRKQVTLNLSVPKFDVSSDIDLIGQLSALGVTDVFDAGLADFSPMTEQSDGLAVTEAKHAARVKIDEEGCLAAAYTVMMVEETAMMPPEEEVDLVLDRPFLFVLTARDGSVLFMGIVNNPAAN